MPFTEAQRAAFRKAAEEKTAFRQLTNPYLWATPGKQLPTAPTAEKPKWPSRRTATRAPEAVTAPRAITPEYAARLTRFQAWVTEFGLDWDTALSYARELGIDL